MERVESWNMHYWNCCYLPVHTYTQYSHVHFICFKHRHNQDLFTLAYQQWSLSHITGLLPYPNPLCIPWNSQLHMCALNKLYLVLAIARQWLQPHMSTPSSIITWYPILPWSIMQQQKWWIEADHRQRQTTEYVVPELCMWRVTLNHTQDIRQCVMEWCQ